MDRVKRLVAENAPMLYMHPTDRYMPCSVEWFMDHSELWLTAPSAELHDQEPVKLLGQGEVTGIGIAAAQKQHRGQHLQLRLHPSAKCGPPPEEIDDTPLYANVKLVRRPDGTAAALEINYLTFYAHNGWYNVGYLGLWQVGAHDGDWEHLTVRLDAATGALQGVYFNAHRSRDGCWAAAEQLERTPQGRLKAYVALHGHGTYPSAGIWWRAGLMANDRTSDRGPVWAPHTCFLLPRPRLDSHTEPEVPPSADRIGAGPGGSPPTDSGQPSGGSETASAGGSGKGSEVAGRAQSGGVVAERVEPDLQHFSQLDIRTEGSEDTAGAAPSDASGLSAANGVHQHEPNDAACVKYLRPAEVAHPQQLHSPGKADARPVPEPAAQSQAGINNAGETTYAGAGAHLIAEGPHHEQLVAEVDAVPAPAAQSMARVSAMQSIREMELLSVPSRGSALPPPPALTPTISNAHVEVLEHSGEWLEFLGQWGTTPSPASQGWYWTAEPPVSRGVFLRIVGHLWPETQAI